MVSSDGNKTLNVVLVGCGRIAAKHAELLGGGRIAGARLEAVCDTLLPRARIMGDQYGVSAYDDMHRMLKAHPRVDIISILTPSGDHARHLLELVGYGKHMVIEKPMALTLGDADAMIEACARHRVKLFVVKQNRFNLPVQRLKEAVDQGRFGKLVMGTVRVRWCRRQDYYDQAAWRGTWAQDGGVFTHQASHHIDLLEWLMGDVASVFARGTTALARIETEDTGAAVIKFCNGALGIIEATTATRPKDLEGSISILGERGSVVIEGFAVNRLRTWQFEDQGPLDEAILRTSSENPPDVYGFGHKAQYDHIVDCIAHDRKALVDGVEGRKSLEVIAALYGSIETGREIFLKDKPEKCRLGRYDR